MSIAPEKEARDRPAVDLDDLDQKGASKRQRLAVSKTYKLYIGGAFPRTESGRYDRAESPKGELLANVCRASRKDFREAVVAARAAQSGWAQRSAYNRAQILYRIAEMLEGRGEQFEAELRAHGASAKDARREVEATVDRLVYYAGWADKYQQVFGSVNPVASSHFNFSLLEPMGVIAQIAPEASALLGLVSQIAPAIVGGNTVVALASRSKPLPAISFGEVLHSSDVPGGVVNLLTGRADELLEHFASHMDVNALVLARRGDSEAVDLATARTLAASNLKRVRATSAESLRDFLEDTAQGPWSIRDLQEVKTTWHPIGS